MGLRCLPASRTYRYLHLSSHTHTPPWKTLSFIPSQPKLSKTTEFPLLSILGRGGSSLPPSTVSGTCSGAGQTSTRAGRRGTASSPLLLAVCCQVRVGCIGNLSAGNQNTFTFPRTRIHLKLCSNNLHKQIYYAILCYAALTSVTL